LQTTVKTGDLKKDAETMSQTFERTVDRKDAIIRSLAMDIEEAEEQYQVALRKHLQNMDDLIGEGGRGERVRGEGSYL
jgi:adenine-specific DNA methylase